jgi:8-oxo-dGTP pyrophosphatase MutT (NUDIX family)
LSKKRWKPNLYLTTYMKDDRSHLPYRINCEGYFTDGQGNILARPSGRGYLIFPGGGVDSGEVPEAAMLRETQEETGATVRITRYLGKISYEWPPTWAQTDKQRQRYIEFRGEEMHFFTGVVEALGDAGDEEDAWQGQKLMPLAEVIALDEALQAFPPEMQDYYGAQLNFLRQL